MRMEGWERWRDYSSLFRFPSSTYNFLRRELTGKETGRRFWWKTSLKHILNICCWLVNCLWVGMVGVSVGNIVEPLDEPLQPNFGQKSNKDFWFGIILINVVRLVRCAPVWLVPPFRLFPWVPFQVFFGQHSTFFQLLDTIFDFRTRFNFFQLITGSTTRSFWQFQVYFGKTSSAPHLPLSCTIKTNLFMFHLITGDLALQSSETISTKLFSQKQFQQNHFGPKGSTRYDLNNCK